MQILRTVFLILVILVATRAFAGDDAKPADKPTNAKCPVMLGEGTSLKYFVEYNGQKVYLCCRKCVGKFQKDPEKYMKRLNDMNKPDAAGAANRDSTSTATGSDSTAKPKAKTGGKHENEEEDDDDDEKEGSKNKQKKKHDD
jgi:YHS domain-containing protein